MYLLHSGAAEVVNWAGEAVDTSLEGTPEDDEFRNYHVVLRGLAARSLLSYDEVMALVDAGHSRCALPRVRTMYEVFVVAAVLALYGRPSSEHLDLIERYLAHRDVFIRSEAAALLLTGLSPAAEFLSGDALERLDEKRDAAVKKYGKPFIRTWGGWPRSSRDQTPSV